MVLKCKDLLLYKVPEPVEMDGPLVVATRELFWGSCLGNHVSPTISSASACHAQPPLPLSLSLSLCLFYTLSHTHTHTHTHCRSKLPSSMTSLSFRAPSGNEPRKGGSAGPGALSQMSDLIHPDNQGPFGSPVTTATPITTLWVVGRRGQSGPVFLASIFNGQCT